MLMYRKELLEMARNYKWIWIPCVFVLLGVMQPLTNHLMPQILDAAGGLPEGAIIEIPPPVPSVVILETLSNFGLIGVLVVVLSSMSIVSGERNSGVAGMVLVRPVRFLSYITAKWAGAMTLVACSLLLGSLSAWYYTELLIGDLSLLDTLYGSLLYLLWFAVILALVVFFSATLKGAGPAAFLSLALVLALSLLTGMLPAWMTWSPSRLTAHAASLLTEGQLLDLFWLNILVSVTMTVVLLVSAAALFRNRPLVD